MNRAGKIGWFGLGVAAVLGLQGAVVLLVLIGISERPDPAANGAVDDPWGAVDLDGTTIQPECELEESMADSFRDEVPAAYDADGDGIRTYHLLALSGGGSNGAYGAGVLCGWTASGDRPDFKIVTGVSTGSLQAACAFLGSDYDYIAKEIFTAYSTPDIYARRTVLAPLINDGMTDSAPLKALIDQYVTPEILEAVAREHAKGRRLYVGTTNVDTAQFVIWDLGAIAASGQPGALDRIRKVLLASCSIPVFFPPVYFEVEADGRQAYEMHVDGGAHALAFFRGFMLEFEDAMVGAGMDPASSERILYVIRNGPLEDDPDERNVTVPRGVSIGAACLKSLLDMSTQVSLYRMYMLCGRYQIDFNLAAIPSEFADDLDMTVFDPVAMKSLFDLGYGLAEKGYPWRKTPPGLDPDELHDSPVRAAARQPGAP